MQNLSTQKNSGVFSFAEINEDFPPKPISNYKNAARTEKVTFLRGNSAADQGRRKRCKTERTGEDMSSFNHKTSRKEVLLENG